MITSVANFLCETAKRYPNKTAFVDEKRSITFSEIKRMADSIATGIIEKYYRRQPIAVYLEKSVECVPAFLGVIESGNFYTPIDTHMPKARIEKIFDTLEPVVVLTDSTHFEEVREFAGNALILVLEELNKYVPDIIAVEQSISMILDSDLVYVLFTSGSTGIPKGVMISERGLIDFTDWASDYFVIDNTYVFGNQTPFYFSFSIYEIYLTLRNACTTYIIPQDCFLYPAMMMEYLFENNINTLIWVPSALTMLSGFKALGSPHLNELKRVWFGAEVMPVKQLNRWMDEYPDAQFVNLYGPTEVTDTCAAYIVNRRFENNELLPIGKACANKEILLLNDDDQIVQGDEIGELCVRGIGLAYGYYNAPDRTAEVFVQNPLNTRFREIIYRTGDLARYNDEGDMVYISRKDFQIKHMGRRVELGEIEANVSAVEGVRQCCCLFDAAKQLIWLFYAGTIEDKDLAQRLNDLLPTYMVPNKRLKMEELPINLNGKFDRPKLKEMM